MNTISSLVLVLTLLTYKGCVDEQIEVQKIYSDGNHNAFTSLIKFNDNYYCAFRSGERHVYGKNGAIKIIVSDDAKTWILHHQFESDKYDLRDPKLCVMPGGRIMVLIGGSEYQGKELLSQQTHVAFSAPGGDSFSSMQPIVLDSTIHSGRDWLWRVTWHNAIAYGVVYQGRDKSASLVSSRDGIHFSLIKKLKLSGRPNEATIRFFDNENMAILIRREEEDKLGYWGVSPPPYIDWTWAQANFRLGGPDYIILDNKHILAGSRRYHEEGNYTALLLGDMHGIFEELYKLPSGGDTSYPGILYEKNRIYMSYYSSHEGSTDVYLATIPVKFVR